MKKPRYWLTSLIVLAAIFGGFFNAWAGSETTNKNFWKPPYASTQRSEWNEFNTHLDNLDARLGINAKAYGAIGNGTTDDTTAIQSAINAISTTGGWIFFPPGVYKITTALSITNKSIHIIGAGPEITEIRATGCHGFSISSDVYWRQILLENFTLATTNAGTYKGIIFTLTQSGYTKGKSLTVKDMIIRGSAQTGEYWTTGIELNNGWYAKILNTAIQGDGANLNNATFGVRGIGQSVNVVIKNCDIFYHQVSIKVEGTGEGWFVDDNRLIGGDNGIWWATTADEPLLLARGNHIDHYLKGIFLDNGVYCILRGNSIFLDRSKGNASGIHLKSNFHNTVGGNHIIVHGTGNTVNAIVLENSDHNPISGNTVLGVSADVDVGVYMPAGNDYNTVIGNTFQECTTGVSDAGTGNDANHNTTYNP
jgi:hypothetical protein